MPLPGSAASAAEMVEGIRATEPILESFRSEKQGQMKLFGKNEIK